MATLTITNCDTGSVVCKDGVFRDELLTFSGAGTALEGTLLARKLVSDTITATPDGGNTGDGTCTALSVVTGPVVPLVGAYNLECITATANGGTFKLEDPNGALISNTLVMTAGAGAATVFEVGGMTFTLTDGATDFAAGDKFALAVTAVNKMVVFASDGLGGAQFANAVLTYDVTATGAGDISIRALEGGEVRKERLIIDADGDGSNITNAILDSLRHYGIMPVGVFELGDYDNQ